MSAFLSRVIAGSCVAVAVFGLAGCAIVDEYSGRAVVYNLQAEQAQEQALLLNVVRASLRRPMQFTGLQSITGTASASGNVTGSASAASMVPLISLFNLIPPASSTLIKRNSSGTVGGGLTLSGGPSFIVPVLDTKEFYYGFLSPIPGQVIDLYLQYGYPRDVLFNIVIERLIIKRTDGYCQAQVHTPDCELTIRNYPPEDVTLGLFQGLMGYLIRLGLTTEALREVGASKGQKAASSASGSSDTSKLTPYAFCFSPRDRFEQGLVQPSVLCQHPALPVDLKTTIGHRSIVDGVVLANGFINELYEEVVAPKLINSNDPDSEPDSRANGFASLRSFAGKRVSVSLTTRSVEGILYYLGEVVRRTAQPESKQSPSPVQVRVGPPQNPFPKGRCPGGLDDNADGYRCTNLFVVEEGGLHPDGITVVYQGVQYSLSADTKNSWTLPTFDLIKQLQALNTSAKDLPQSNLISVISNQ